MTNELIPSVTPSDVAESCLRRVRDLQELAVSLENMTLKTVLRDLLATIELHTDCMNNQIDRTALDPYIEKAEKILGERIEDIAA